MIKKTALILALALVSCGQSDSETDSSSAGVRYGKGLCGAKTIKGERIGHVSGQGACGIDDAVRVYAVSGVTLSEPATLTCDTARALDTWVRKVARPATKKMGGVAKLKVAAHYVCRTRNHKKGARISEHAKGNAIDISAVYLRDGTELSVLRDYYSKNSKGRALQSMREGACGTFGTVLGPGSDAHHRDHLHFDTARYSYGPYCR